MPLLSELCDLRGRLQADLFPYLEESLGPLAPRYQQLVTVFEMAPVSALLTACPGGRGRPPADRVPVARAFIAKAVFNIPTTSHLIERLAHDKTLRRLCGWHRVRAVPSEATFSRAFAEFAASELAVRMHQTLILATQKDRLIGHISRDATAIEAREKPVKVEALERRRSKKKPQKGEPGYDTVRRLERQRSMTLTEMHADLPKQCAVGIKPDAKGFKTAWTGYKRHLDIADGGIPISAILTSASLHDSQAAIPLATMTAQRITNCYDLMDPAYDAPEIDAACRALGRIPIVPPQARRDAALEQELAAESKARRTLNFETAEQVRYRERTTAERANGRLKDEFGGRCVRVRGHAKVMGHLMFGILALTVDQLMRLVAG